MKTITEEQQKCIDLIKTGEFKNIRIAYDLNESMQLGVDELYYNFFKKHKKTLRISETESPNFYFPMLSTKGVNMPTYLEGNNFDDKIEGVIDFLKDFIFFIGFDGSEITVFVEEMSIDDIENLENAYESKFKYQKLISEKTGIDKKLIYIK